MPKPKGKGASQTKKRCVKPTSYPCGFTCIARKNPSGTDRICHNILKNQAKTFTLWLALQEERLAKVNKYRTDKGRATYSLNDSKLGLVKNKLSETAKVEKAIAPQKGKQPPAEIVEKMNRLLEPLQEFNRLVESARQTGKVGGGASDRYIWDLGDKLLAQMNQFERNRKAWEEAYSLGVKNGFDMSAFNLPTTVPLTKSEAKALKERWDGLGATKEAASPTPSKPAATTRERLIAEENRLGKELDAILNKYPGRRTDEQKAEIKAKESEYFAANRALRDFNGGKSVESPVIAEVKPAIDAKSEAAIAVPSKTETIGTILKVGAKQVDLPKPLSSYSNLNLSHDPSLGWQVTDKDGDVLRQPKTNGQVSSHRFKERGQAENFAKTVMAKVDRAIAKQQKAAKPEPTKATQSQKEEKATRSIEQQKEDLFSKGIPMDKDIPRLRESLKSDMTKWGYTPTTEEKRLLDSENTYDYLAVEKSVMKNSQSLRSKLKENVLKSREDISAEKNAIDQEIEKIDGQIEAIKNRHRNNVAKQATKRQLRGQDATGGDGRSLNLSPENRQKINALESQRNDLQRQSDKLKSDLLQSQKESDRLSVDSPKSSVKEEKAIAKSYAPPVKAAPVKADSNPPVTPERPKERPHPSDMTLADKIEELREYYETTRPIPKFGKGSNGKYFALTPDGTRYGYGYETEADAINAAKEYRKREAKESAERIGNSPGVDLHIKSSRENQYIKTAPATNPPSQSTDQPTAKEFGDRLTLTPDDFKDNTLYLGIEPNNDRNVSFRDQQSIRASHGLVDYGNEYRLVKSGDRAKIEYRPFAYKKDGDPISDRVYSQERWQGYAGDYRLSDTYLSTAIADKGIATKQHPLVVNANADKVKRQAEQAQREKEARIESDKQQAKETAWAAIKKEMVAALPKPKKNQSVSWKQKDEIITGTADLYGENYAILKSSNSKKFSVADRKSGNMAYATGLTAADAKDLLGILWKERGDKPLALKDGKADVPNDIAQIAVDYSLGRMKSIPDRYSKEVEDRVSSVNSQKAQAMQSNLFGGLDEIPVDKKREDAIAVQSSVESTKKIDALNRFRPYVKPKKESISDKELDQRIKESNDYFQSIARGGKPGRPTWLDNQAASVDTGRSIAGVGLTPTTKGFVAEQLFKLSAFDFPSAKDYEGDPPKVTVRTPGGGQYQIYKTKEAISTFLDAIGLSPKKGETLFDALKRNSEIVQNFSEPTLSPCDRHLLLLATTAANRIMSYPESLRQGIVNRLRGQLA